MELCAGQYRYLLSIYRLQKEQKTIRCVDIANDLGVTRPSVSKMMKCMVRMELIEPDYCQSVRLTHKGLEIAVKSNHDYDMVYAFFRRMIRLSPDEAKEHAFLFISTFPAATSKRLAEIMQNSIEANRRKKALASDQQED
ncbi:MAG: metal-dependent transcriptional regulator [Oscillospiraceae bacterium]|nr:metal-dependent transcriptional regulator [Oscillospiraceae bacterium]